MDYEIYEKEDGWYYRTAESVEWGPFENYEEAELAAEFQQPPDETLNRSSGEIEGDVF